MGFDLSLYSDWLVEIGYDRLMAVPGVSKHMAGWSPTRQSAFLAILASFDCEQGSIGSDVVEEVEAVLNQKHGRHDQRTHGRGGRTQSRGEGISGSKLPQDQRVWQGQQYARPDQPLTKAQQGELGELIAMEALEDKYGVGFEGLNVGRNNAPLDVKGDHLGVEVKAGMAYNGRTSRSWNSKLGGERSKQKERLAALSEEDRKAFRQEKRSRILVRKRAMLEELSMETGERFTGKMVGVIMTPDGRSGDVFEVDGFHFHLGWGANATNQNYLGTYNVGQEVFDSVMAKAITREGLLEMDHPLKDIVRDYELAWFTPEQEALLRYPIIWWWVEAHEADIIGLFVKALVDQQIDPKTITEDELEVIWNRVHPELHTEPASIFKHGQHDQRTHGQG